MATVERTMLIEPDRIYETLTTPESYPHWLVGAREIRSVDDGWPAVGTAFHHRVGLIGPLKISDRSQVVDLEPRHRLVLDVRARPLGRAHATFDLTAVDGGRCTVRLHEVPVGPAAVLGPIVDPLIARRNRQSLEHLEDYVLHGRSHRHPG